MVEKKDFVNYFPEIVLQEVGILSRTAYVCSKVFNPIVKNADNNFVPIIAL